MSSLNENSNMTENLKTFLLILSQKKHHKHLHMLVFKRILKNSKKMFFFGLYTCACKCAYAHIVKFSIKHHKMYTYTMSKALVKKKHTHKKK